MCPNSLQQQVTRRDTNSRMQIRLSARSTSFGETLRLEIKGFVIARFPGLDFPWKNRNPSNKNIRRESSFFFVSDLAQSPSPRRRKAWWVVRERERERANYRKDGGGRNAVGRLLGHPSTNSGSLRKCMKRDMKCTSSDVLASGQADNQLIEACGCIFIIYYRLPDAFLHIVRHSRCQSLTYRLERISRTGCPERLFPKRFKKNSITIIPR